jgi:putative ATPase
MDLFDMSREEQLAQKAPLADRMRPRTLEEFVGQEHILGEGKLLRRSIEADRLTSVILYGPPGTGKTTLGHIIANTTEAYFEQLNAVTSGIADLRAVIENAEERLGMHGRRTVLFIDEIHRFNKAQQDALLPAVERGIVILIGSTTENPYFEVNAPLVSRSRVFQFEPLEEQHIRCIVLESLEDSERGLGEFSVTVDDEALEHIVDVANGDARSALAALELAVLTTPPDSAGKCRITLEVAEDSIQQRAVVYDKQGDNHYDTVSAFIKSMRGSDPDAALYWFVRMLHAGEDPRFIMRRVLVHAAEDVGLADPRALTLASAAAHALELVGLPEARIPMAEAVLYVAVAPKSNAVVSALARADRLVENERAGPIPSHLRDASYSGADRLGAGQGYKYPHDFPGGYVQQQYLPEGLEEADLYQPGTQGLEQRIKKRLDKLKQRNDD